MTTPQVRPKWRPPLALIVYAILITVMALPFFIVVWFRVLELEAGRLAPAEAGALLVALAVTLIMGFVLTRTITAPIDALIARTEDIGRRGRSAIKPPESHGTRELAVLSQGFMDLASQLVDRTDYIRTFATHVSHELKSPLTAIRGAAELLRDDEPDLPMTPEQRRHFLDNIIADTERLGRLLNRLRDLAQAEAPIAEGETRMTEIVPHLSARIPALDIRIVGDGEASLALPLETACIIIGNLLQNAVEHGASAVAIDVSTSRRGATIRVSDNGRGIAPGDAGRIFEPFFSTRRLEGGTGLGLDIVRAMLSAHQGTIALEDGQAPGARFLITLPPAR